MDGWKLACCKSPAGMVKGEKIKGSGDDDRSLSFSLVWFGVQARVGTGRAQQRPTQVRLETDKTCLFIVLRHSFIHSLLLLHCCFAVTKTPWHTIIKVTCACDKGHRIL